MPQPLSNPGWPPTNPYPESQQDTLGDGSPDFPGSAGGREQGKFRPGKLPKTTTIAVVNDDGSPVFPTSDAPSIFEEMLMELKAIRLGIETLASILEPDLGEFDLNDLVTEDE